MSRSGPPSLSTGYDLLPLPTSQQFELDRNLPLPARRITVAELVREVDDDQGRESVIPGKDEDGDGADWGEGIGKVRVYGRVIQYLPDQGVLLINDPDTPKSPGLDVDPNVDNSGPPTTISGSKPNPRLKPPPPNHPNDKSPSLPWIGISTSILSTHLPHPGLPTTSSSSNSGSGPGEHPWKDRQNVPRDLDAFNEYALGRYPAGSGRPSGAGSDVGARKGRGRSLGSIRLERGEGVCIVGWVRTIREFQDRGALSISSSSLGAGESPGEDEHTEEKAKEQQDDESESELELDRRARQSRSDKQAWERLWKRGWVLDAIQIWNVPFYEPGVGLPMGGPPGAGQAGRMDRADVFHGGGTRREEGESGWGRRKGLERYD